jgi:branched-chain amino acid transport system substrate-binding protein
VFRTVGRDDIQGPTMANYILKSFPKAKVAIIHDKTTYGKGVADEAKKALNAGGLKEVMYEAINRGDKDFTALISKMKQAKIDVMILGGYHPEGAAIIKQSREQGFGAEVKRRIMLGTYALSSGYYDAYYGTAQKVRTKIADDFRAAWESFDFVVTPTSPTVAFG